MVTLCLELPFLRVPGLPIVCSVYQCPCVLLWATLLGWTCYELVNIVEAVGGWPTSLWSWGAVSEWCIHSHAVPICVLLEWELECRSSVWLWLYSQWQTGRREWHGKDNTAWCLFCGVWSIAVWAFLCLFPRPLLIPHLWQSQLGRHLQTLFPDDGMQHGAFTPSLCLPL